jgi:hypothetical protein
MKTPPIEATEASTPSQWCAVFDARTGKVVHVHQFVPASARTRCTADDLAKEALRIAAQEHPDADLKPVPASAAKTLDPRVNYRFDTKSRKLIVERSDLTTGARVVRRDKVRSSR